MYKYLTIKSEHIFNWKNMKTFKLNVNVIKNPRTTWTILSHSKLGWDEDMYEFNSKLDHVFSRCTVKPEHLVFLFWSYITWNIILAYFNHGYFRMKVHWLSTIKIIFEYREKKYLLLANIVSKFFHLYVKVDIND